MRQNNLARKKKQLKGLADKLQHLIMYHRMEAGAQIEKLILKIKILVQELAGVLSHTALKNILGAAAVLAGISFSNKADAQSFAAPVSNPFGLESVNFLAFPAFADLDGDGDNDLLVGEYYGVLKYFQNTGTTLNPQFAAPQVNPFGLDSNDNLAIPSFADLDGDGDLDLLAGGYYGVLKYFQNTGTTLTPQFAAPLVNPFGLVLTDPIAFPMLVDLDADGDYDLFIGEYYGVLKYFQNIGTMLNPHFAVPMVNPFGLDSTFIRAAPTFADLDDDGDMDLLVGEYYGTMKYFENSGSAFIPQFVPPLTNPFGLVVSNYYALPAFADLDDDGDPDLLVGVYYGVMQYFENLSLTGIADFSRPFNLKLFPNPANNILNLDSDENIDKIEIFNYLGENVITVKNQVSQISLNHLSPGIYMVKVTSVLGNVTTGKMQKQ